MSQTEPASIYIDTKRTISDISPLLFSQMAQGKSLQPLVEAPMYQTRQFGDMPLLDVSAAHNVENATNSIFIVNRGQDDSVPLTVIWQDVAPNRIISARQIAGSDPKAVNSWDNPNNITIRGIQAPKISDGVAQLVLPPLSFTALEAAL